jgi:hypothetical protein
MWVAGRDLSEITWLVSEKAGMGWDGILPFRAQSPALEGLFAGHRVQATLA